MLNTPDDHQGPERGDKARFWLKKTRPPLVAFIIIVGLVLALVLTGFEGGELGAFVGAVLLYLAKNAPATMKTKAKKFLSGLIEPFYGCRTCQA